jgi:hypothetical protein
MFILKMMIFVMRMFVYALKPVFWLMGDRSNTAEDRETRRIVVERKARQRWAHVVAEAERTAASDRQSAAT